MAEANWSVARGRTAAKPPPPASSIPQSVAATARRRSKGRASRAATVEWRTDGAPYPDGAYTIVTRERTVYGTPIASMINVASAVAAPSETNST